MKSFSKLSSGPKKFQKLLWAHRPSKPTIGFLEMLTPMWGFVCLLLRRHVKMTEIQIAHNKIRLLYYLNSPPFHFIAINFIKIYHKCSKSQKSWKMVTKIYQIFFLQNHFLNQNILFRCHINIFWEEKKMKNFVCYNIFSKNCNF